MNINPGGQPNGGISLSPDGSTLYVPVNLDKLVAINASTGVVEDSSRLSHILTMQLLIQATASCTRK